MTGDKGSQVALTIKLQTAELALVNEEEERGGKQHQTGSDDI